MTDQTDSTLGAVEEPCGPNEPVLATFHAYDREQIDLYAHALGYLVVLDAIENALWTDWKWAELPPDVYAYVEKLRDKIFELKTENHLPN